MNRLEKIFERYLPVSENKEEMEISSDGRNGGFYSLRGVAEELKIPVNVLENILMDFFDDAAEVIDSLKLAEKEKNFQDIEKLSHKLKGAAYNLRLNSLAEIFDLIESKAHNKEDSDYISMINESENELMLYKSYIN